MRTPPNGVVSVVLAPPVPALLVLAEALSPDAHHQCRYRLLNRKHHETVPGATEAHVSVQHHSADTYPTRSKRSGKDAYPWRDYFTALRGGGRESTSDERRDGTQAMHYTRALEWCATFSAGSDGTHLTAGMGYWKGLVASQSSRQGGR